MRWLARFQMLVRSLFYHRRAESELRDELQDHLNREFENNIRLGMSPEEARSAAQRLVGSVELFKEECRDQRSAAFLENLARDFRYAVQMLRRTPLFSAIAILTLALGIGANTFIFTFVENVLLRSLPVSDPEHLVSLNWGGAPVVSQLRHLPRSK